MKKKSIALRSLKLNKEAISSLQNKHAVVAGGSNNTTCFPPDDGTIINPGNSNQCATQNVGLCPRDSDLCYSGKRYISQCCV
ncbi:hypothetical protein [Taibaiella koreensis]|uniref:hypothetical protein n=1 Tax=Taibaiella koreensis TaxID=1268548 RepID=UPI000E5A0928|nr:hypothetical protein [Taibaiella koreensis]